MRIKDKIFINGLENDLADLLNWLETFNQVLVEKITNIKLSTENREKHDE